jgi:hypothetical protein
MRGDRIWYRDGYKYQLHRTYSVQVDIFPPRDIITPYLLLNGEGRLAIMAGYAWDGPSGPALDTRDFMRGSLVHDALYQLMREGYLDPGHRARADSLLREMCKEDGMPHLRAQYVFMAVSAFGGAFIDPAADHPPLTAP